MAFACARLDNVNYFFTLVRSSMAPKAESVASADWGKGKTGIRRDEGANHLHLLLDGEAAEAVLQIRESDSPGVIPHRRRRRIAPHAVPEYK